MLKECSKKGKCSPDCEKILSLVYGAILTASVRSGLGQHAYALEPFAVMTAIRLYAAGIPFGILSVALPACAIAIILEKITAPSKRQVRFLYGVPALNIVIKIGNVILVYTTCPPADTQRFFKLSTACVSRYVVIYYLYISTCMPHLYIDGVPESYDDLQPSLQAFQLLRPSS